MGKTKAKSRSAYKYKSHRLQALVTAALLCCCAIVWLGGCSVVDLFKPEPLPYNETISGNYANIELKKSTSADALTTIYMPEYELLSQSESVIASVGSKKKGYKIWFNMVAFDEDTLTAQRKYLFIEDEIPKSLFVEPWANAKFDCKMVIPGEVLDKPYSSENAKRIEVLKSVLENLRKDIEEVKLDNKMIEIASMTINQGFEAALVKLDNSPALAAKLSEPKGLEFSNMSYDKGRIRMLIDEDIVTIEIKLGSIVKKRLGLPVKPVEDMQEK